MSTSTSVDAAPMTKASNNATMRVEVSGSTPTATAAAISRTAITAGTCVIRATRVASADPATPPMPMSATSSPYP